MAELILTISIPSSKVTRSKERFLAVKPNTQVIEGEPVYSDKEWFEECLKQFLRKIDNRGKRRIAEKAIEDQTDMFES